MEPTTDSDRMRLERMLERERDNEAVTKRRAKFFDGVKTWSQWLTAVFTFWIVFHTAARDVWQLIGGWLKSRV